MIMKEKLSGIIGDIFPVWGVCSFDSVKDSLIHCRAESRLPKESRSIITALFPYLLPGEMYRGINISKYAAVCDYHGAVTDRLERVCVLLRAEFPGEEFVPFADNTPIPEHKAAFLAGLGFRGRNGLIINPVYGSYAFVGEIVTTLSLEPDSPLGNCTGCGKCLEACPTGALKGLPAPCVSAVTQKKGVLSPEEEKLIIDGGLVWGCDICQDVCPMNRNVSTTPIEEFINSCEPRVTDETSIENRAFAWRGKDVIKRNLELTGG